ncbi:MAG: AbrB/MazE/SpoVT family DNA-binding domain-containing protein [Aquificota bacterium]|uniref:AbrB/MazE/SpoVT family DNA-binding domain-containing protein n=1 Tax=Thermosulfidibacter takaii TaxID=412593 RepID=A0A7C0YBR3_9BACT|nr:MAG: AbrB/MazE/SpoVT family DNA-binding domain-containing protein [Aquificota bacterium]HDD53558.1 AbrB/MazE/SpoVT family DNA-binding domain-containing protein [Thermosulfidibacter takaii]
MPEVATTRMSSKGQVVIPEEIRKKLNLKPGARFVVVAEGDALLLKLISSPSMEEFDRLLEKARRAARKAGITKREIEDAIKKVRQAQSGD